MTTVNTAKIMSELKIRYASIEVSIERLRDIVSRKQLEMQLLRRILNSIIGIPSMLEESEHFTCALEKSMTSFGDINLGTLTQTERMTPIPRGVRHLAADSRNSPTCADCRVELLDIISRILPHCGGNPLSTPGRISFGLHIIAKVKNCGR
jgi:uncharacterized coiled-coil protein SlyX